MRGALDRIARAPAAPGPSRVLRTAALAAVALVLAGLAAGVASAGGPPRTPALPKAGLLVPDRSLGGVRLGMTRAQVRARWGTSFGRCRSCADETWYFTYEPFTQQGAGVTFQRGKVADVFTLFQPPGWRTTRGVVLGDPETEVSEAFGPLLQRRCDRYDAYLRIAEAATTVFYVYEGELWGFGLTLPGRSPCR